MSEAGEGLLTLKRWRLAVPAWLLNSRNRLETVWNEMFTTFYFIFSNNF